MHQAEIAIPALHSYAILVVPRTCVISEPSRQRNFKTSSTWDENEVIQRGFKEPDLDVRFYFLFKI